MLSSTGLEARHHADTDRYRPDLRQPPPHHRAHAQAITCIEATTPAKPGADGKKSLASALLSKLAAHLDPAQARIALAALDAEQAPARQAARDLFNRTLDTDHPAARKAEVAEIEQIARPNPDNRCHPRGSMTEQTDTADATRFMVPAGCVDARPTAYRAWRSLGYTPMQCLAVVYGQPSLYLLGSECPSARSGASPRHTSRCAVASACP